MSAVVLSIVAVARGGRSTDHLHVLMRNQRLEPSVR